MSLRLGFFEKLEMAVHCEISENTNSADHIFSQRLLRLERFIYLRIRGYSTKGLRAAWPLPHDKSRGNDRMTDGDMISCLGAAVRAL